jgi:hypothetical protein
MLISELTDEAWQRYRASGGWTRQRHGIEPGPASRANES